MNCCLWHLCSYLWNKGKGIADDSSSDDVWLEWEAQQLKVCSSLGVKVSCYLKLVEILLAHQLYKHVFFGSFCSSSLN